MILKRNKFSDIKKNKRAGNFLLHHLFFIGFCIVGIGFGIIILTQTKLLEKHALEDTGTRLTTITLNEAAGQEDSDLSATSVEEVPSFPVVNEKVKAAAPLETNNYGIAAGGGLIHLSQEHLNEYFDLLQALGVRWVRWDIDWSVVQKDGPASYNWEGTDRVVLTANKYGINSLAIITYAPRWAADKACRSGQRCAPADPQAFGDFSKEAAARYKNYIHHWEIWNEPNYTFFWSPRPSAKQYAQVLEAASLQIKAEDPEAIVVSGGLAACGNEKDGSLSPLTFTKSLYSLEANQYFDALALHPYTYPVSLKYKAWWNRWQQVLPIRKLMVENGDGEKKMWFTEFGAPTGGPGRAFAVDQTKNFEYDADFMKETAQKSLMVEILDFYRKNQDFMGPFFWYSLKDDSDRRSTTENFFGLLRYDGSEKPAYEFFQSVITEEE